MTNFQLNENKVDRVIRIALGLIIIGGGISAVVWGDLAMSLGIVIGIIGFIPLITGLVGWCPLYALLKFTTCESLSCKIDKGMPKSV